MVEQRRSSSWSRFSCGKTREEKKRNRDIRLIIRDLQPTCRSKSRYCFNPSLSLSLFFFPFLFLVSVRFFRIASFRKRGKKTGGWKTYALPWKLEEWGIVAEESLIKELIF